jgi:demethylmenaquinone methyltransferase/2-methoxy-6-polyprenyl-1,4-benzoquinol methylase
MNKQDIIAFFDRLAPQWDADMIRSDEIIGKILDGAEIAAGDHVLDVACGTGVLFPDYASRKVASVTGIDISPEMARIAQEKFPWAAVICGDVEKAPLGMFDRIMVYNAFPHFPNPEKLIAVLSAHLKPSGTLTVAHGMSRAAIDRHHKGSASKVSMGLMHEDQLEKIFCKHLSVTVKISDETMYQVTGKKK